MSPQPNLVSSKNANKRHLSTTSLSPKAEEKKTKLFTSPNRFSVLANRDDTDVNLSGSCNVNTSNSADKPCKIKVPSVYIKNVDNISSFTSSLMTVLDSTDFIYKSTPSYLIIRTHSVEHYNLLLSHLEENDYSYHSYQPDVLRTLRIVIRNLHPSTKHEDIIASLSELGHHVTNIHNIKRFSDKTPLPIFFVNIQKATNNSDIFKVKFLLNSTIAVEKPHPPKSPPQCYTCQSYGHTRKYCYHEPRCVKCGEDHTSDSCSKSRDSPARCALCKGNHTANYKGCPNYKKIKHPKPPIRSEPHIPTPYPKHNSTRAASGSNQPSYAYIASSGQNLPQPQSSIECLLTSFISEFSNILKPLLSLLTSLLSKSQL
jgi:hypothetical protein